MEGKESGLVSINLEGYVMQNVVIVVCVCVYACVYVCSWCVFIVRTINVVVCTGFA